MTASNAPSPAPTRWLLLQLVDGSFPSGGFAHSAGLEAAARFGGLSAVEPFLDQAILQAARGSLPLVRAACDAPASLPSLDDHCHAFLTSEVTSRASRAQGRALASSAGRIFDAPGVAAIAHHARHHHAHHAPVFGALYGALGIPADEAQMAFLHGVTRTVLSAAVRLSLLGPLEAQALHAASASRLDRALALASTLGPDDIAQTAPLVELFGSLHDALDARLFQS